MKRRSARPFAVEVKHARPVRGAHTTAFAQKHTAKTLWPDLIQAEMKRASPEVHPAASSQQEPNPPQAPIRRILPNIMPVFADAIEAEAQPGPAKVRAPRARSPKAKIEDAPVLVAAEVAMDTVTAATKLSADTKTATEGVSSDSFAVAAPLTPKQGLSRRLTSRLSGDLRPGERWKRRLPQRLR